MSTKISLSQCMIVRDEEENIEKALSWGKGIVSEQIVVDTGSVDNTAAIAERMGAKVYHFEWIDDFAAAKNFAIEKASGNWIAFLDADEYFEDKDAKKLIMLLEGIERLKEANRLHMIASRIVHLEKDGSVIGVGEQHRIFRNIKELKYSGKIHEKLMINGNKLPALCNLKKELTIYHTGYAKEVSSRKQKPERNLRMLKKEMDGNPEDYSLVAYYADVLLKSGKKDEAEEMYMHAAEHIEELDAFFKARVLARLMEILVEKNNPEDDEKIRSLYKTGIRVIPEDADIDYMMGCSAYARGMWTETVIHLEAALEKLKSDPEGIEVRAQGSKKEIYKGLSVAAEALDDNPRIVKYTVLCLGMERYQEDVLRLLMTVLKNEPSEKVNAAGTLSVLKKLYNFNSLKDKLYVLKYAKLTGFKALEDKLLAIMSEEEREWLLKENITKKETRIISNVTDAGFYALMDYIDSSDNDVLIQYMEEKAESLKKTESNIYEKMLLIYERFSFWGKLCPENGEYEVFTKRAVCLKENIKKLIWLYERLKDYRSKKTLLAILRNWVFLDTDMMITVREMGEAYFDLDIFPSGEGDVLFEFGKAEGETVQTIQSYIRTYGTGYKHIYCCEMNDSLRKEVNHNLKDYHDITICEGIKEIIEINEPVTFIKMDAEGEDSDLLLKCAEVIKEHHPKLAISIYHGFDDLWRIAGMIDEIDDSYDFYIRHYGGNIVPMEFVLLGV